MSGDASDLVRSLLGGLRAVLAVGLVGAAVKAMDDALDADEDREAGRPNWSRRLGAALTPYALAGLAAACALDPAPALALFFAAYALGMGARPGARMPSGLPAWAESLLALAAAGAVAGPRTAAFAVALTAGLQWLDDWVDQWPGARRPVRALLGAAALLAAAAADPVRAAAGTAFGLAVILRRPGEAPP